MRPRPMMPLAGVALSLSLVLAAVVTPVASALAEPPPVTVNPSYTDGGGGIGLGVDSRRGLVYMPLIRTPDVVVYDEATRAATKVALAPGVPPNAVGVDEGTGFAYVPRGWHSDQVTVLRAGALVGSVTLPGLTDNLDVAVDPVRHLAYVTGSSSLYVLRGTDLMATVPVGNRALAAGVNPRNGLVYVPNYDDGSVSVIRGTAVVATVDTGGHPTQAAVDPSSGLVYVTNYDDTVSVLRGTRPQPVATLQHVGSDTYAIAVDPQSHLVYVTDDEDQTVTVIHGIGVIRTLHVPVAYERSVTVNPVTGLVLVAGGSAQTVTAIRGSRVVHTSTSGDETFQPAFDRRTGRAFVSTGNTLMDLQTPTLPEVTVRRPQRGQLYKQGAHALVRYGCIPGTNNVLRSCHARVRSGKPIDTRTAGRHALTVAARSAYGATVRTTIHYRVRR